MIVYRAALAVCFVLPGSASAKQPRSSGQARVSIDAPVSGQWSHERRLPRLRQITSSRSFAAVPMRCQTCSGRRGLTRRQRINGRRRAALGKRSAPSHSPPCRSLSPRSGNKTSFLHRSRPTASAPCCRAVSTGSGSDLAPAAPTADDDRS
jgi:hypothetical protein